MSDDDEEICRFGTPLDPIKEDEIPSKKPITIADQIAVDANGRRRFHGAFTGGFSAGFWNTVGSKEGWTPQAFKSSRAEKAMHAVQKPNDFMDEEDVGEFGIAPQRIQTREDFTPNESDEKISNKNKRKLPSNSSGPIPGVPVLHLVLESCRDKVAVRLLKRMEPKLAGRILNKVEKPPKTVEPEVELKESPDVEGEEDAEEEDGSVKVYQCDMGPFQRRRSVDDADSDSSDSVGLDDLMFADDEFDEYAKHIKNDRFGLEYVGLDKGTFFGTTSSDVTHQKSMNLFSSFEMVDKNNKKLSIKGQAFGVGAFEDDDDDIYAKDDMSKYDFLLGGKANASKKPTKAIESTKTFIDGFVESPSNVAPKKVFHVNVPRSFEPRNWLKRRSRFGPATVSEGDAVEQKKQVIGRHDMKPSQRGKLLNEKTKNDSVTEPKKAGIDADSMLQAVGLKTMNFVTEAVKSDENVTEQQRSISPSLAENVDDLITKMDASIKTIVGEQRKFEPPAIVPFISDRFVAAGASSTDVTKDSETPPKPPVPEKLPDVKIVRTKSTWVPCQLLCYKMNMEAAVGTKLDTKTKSFSLFSCLTASNEANGKKPLQFTNTGSFLQDAENEVAKQSQKERESLLKQTTAVHEKISVTEVPEPAAPSTSNVPSSNAIKITKTPIPVKKDNVKKTELELKIIDAQDKHPAQKKDIYKAIFDSSDDESDADAEPTTHNTEDNDNIASGSANADMRHTQPTPNYQSLPDIAFMPKSAKEINILRNTSPPRGIFSGLLTKRHTEPVKTVPATVDNKSVELPADSYGPSLPPTFQRKPAAEHSTVSNAKPRETIASISSRSGSVYQVRVEEQWIEKSSTPEPKHKKEKKVKKKSKKERKKDKHKSSHHRDKKKKSKR